MTAKQILDAFSETLMQDERILSPRERELLSNLLQNSKSVSSNNPEIESAVNAAIARSVGETIAQRAFSLLGGSIVEKILGHAGISSRSAETPYDVPAELKAPQPPTPGPGAPQPPTKSPLAPQPPTPGPGPAIAPKPPTGSRASQSRGILAQQKVEQTVSKQSSVQVLDDPITPQARFLVFDEFLAPQELSELMSFVLEREAEFQTSEVISPSADVGTVDYDHRRSRVLMEAGKHESVILDRIHGVLPSVLEELGIEEFPVTRAEVQITASNDGDFFRAHSDDADAAIASRCLTFVFFFHREPKQFEGGELRLHDLPWTAEGQFKNGSYEAIQPRQNQIVFFPSSLLHEITPVTCASRAFADSRFTLNGWLHK